VAVGSADWRESTASPSQISVQDARASRVLAEERVTGSGARAAASAKHSVPCSGCRLPRLPRAAVWALDAQQRPARGTG
jgi:hypothetical protein